MHCAAPREYKKAVKCWSQVFASEIHNLRCLASRQGMWAALCRQLLLDASRDTKIAGGGWASREHNFPAGKACSRPYAQIGHAIRDARRPLQGAACAAAQLQSRCAAWSLSGFAPLKPTARAACWLSPPPEESAAAAISSCRSVKLSSRSRFAPAGRRWQKLLQACRQEWSTLRQLSSIAMSP